MEQFERGNQITEPRQKAKEKEDIEISFVKIYF
jgi:hypothetical protein